MGEGGARSRLGVDLVEREPVLRFLDERVAAAVTGHGSLSFLAGEAGIGKTAVVTALVEHHRPELLSLVGACDALSTPRPLGPLWDMAGRSPELAELLDQADRYALFAGFLELVSTPGKPALVVLEDVHWADAATLDLLRFLGRRVDSTHAAVVTTYRSDEIGADHPLRAILGDLAPLPAVQRQSLLPLTPDGVAELAAGTGIELDALALHRRTDGNPFFVTEVLADPSSSLPDSVRDAVLSRRNRLPEGPRSVVDVVSVVPGAMEPWLLAAVASPDTADIDACVTAGMLRSDERGDLRFRHELARLAVYGAVPPAKLAGLHAAVVRALLGQPEREHNPARIVHHAHAAGEGDIVLGHAVQAAERSSSHGAHRQARDHLAEALLYADRLEDADRAGLLERFAAAAQTVGDTDDALDAIERAVSLRRAGGDARAYGGALRIQASARWEAGKGPEAHGSITDSLEMLTPLGETEELAESLSIAVTLAMLARQYDTALGLGDRAITLAERLGHDAALARALNSVGSVEILIGQPDVGERHLLRSREVARQIGRDQAEAAALTNLGSAFGEVRLYDRAGGYLEEGIAFSTARDLDANAQYTAAWLARVHFEMGRWDEAAALATSLPLDLPGVSPIIPITALAVLGRLRARRGDPGVSEALDRAWALAVETDDLQRLWPVSAARAEAADLDGREDLVPPLIKDTFALAVEIGHPWAIGELGALLRRADALDRGELPVMERAAEPYRLQVAGRVEEAAAAWADLGCPYEEAEALGDGDEDQQRRALEILDGLGAVPAAARLRQRMREAGVRSIPRGPRPATAEHPEGLTPREAEVLELVAEGMTNAEIGEALYISEKTASHHVSSILGKLGVSSRHEAARRIRGSPR